MNYKLAGKLVGNKGSVRVLETMYSESNGGEYVLTAGCDRHIRLFDPNCDLQKSSELASAYCKQKLNSILISNP
jgi:hypothetical protein